MSRINRQPKGLLGFLGIKNTGRNPSTLAEQMLGTWDLSSLYLVNGAEYAQRTDNATVTTTIIGDGPAVGEVWYVHEYGARTANLLAGETVSFAIGIYGPAGTNVFVPTTSLTAVSAVPGDRYCVASNRPVILTPGETLGLFVTDITTVGNVPITTSYRFTRMVA